MIISVMDTDTYNLFTIISLKDLIIFRKNVVLFLDTVMQLAYWRWQYEEKFKKQW